MFTTIALGFRLGGLVEILESGYWDIGSRAQLLDSTAVCIVTVASSVASLI